MGGNPQKYQELQEKANEIRKDIIKMLEAAGSGHSAGPLGLADIFTALYFHVLVHNPKKPDWSGRDILILSNGHCVPVRYATMAHAGYFPIEELLTLRKFGSRLAAMLVSKYKLSNLTAIIDRNNIQIDGPTEKVMPLEDLRAKWEAFGWHVLEINGNDIEAFIDACEMARAVVEKPVMIIAHTIPGKGVDFMEYDFHWHGTAPDHAQAKKALAELRTLGGKIKSEHQ
jgi:transketolase N-terminal domain/subunit